MFTLNSIQKTKEGCVSFLSQLPQGRALRDVIAHAPYPVPRTSCLRYS